MKNSLMIDIDTEREKPVLIGKPPEIKPPTTPEEAKELIILDISCVCEALCSLIHIADQAGYSTKEQLVRASILHLNTLLEPPVGKNETETPSI